VTGIPETVHELCLGFPDTEVVISHGSPDYRVGGKPFASFCLNFHGDGRVALWLRSPPGVQRLYSELNPAAYFVPPYVGPKGWLGVELNKGLDWREIAGRVREAYENAVARPVASTPAFTPPDEDMTPAEINPLLGDPFLSLLDSFARRCLAFPEVTETTQFGSPVWKAGKKTFASAYLRNGRLQFQFRVGVEQQHLMIADARYSIPMYMGHNGWIDLDVTDIVNWDEVGGLLDLSYRHFALKRMLKELDR